MNTPITGALVVCVAAAGVAVGALFLDAGGSPAPSTPGGSPAAAPTDGGGYGSGDGGGTGTGAASASLDISGFQFGTTSVAPGGQVTVNNRDAAPHTVTGAAFDSGQVDGGNAGAFTAPAQPGTYEFQCQIHPEMSGSLTVG